MPRVDPLRVQYMKTDARKLVKEKLGGNEMTQKKLAAVVGLSAPAFCIRLKTFDFDFEHLVKMFDALGLSDAEIVKLMKR